MSLLLCYEALRETGGFFGSMIGLFSLMGYVAFIAMANIMLTAYALTQLLSDFAEGVQNIGRAGLQTILPAISETLQSDLLSSNRLLSDFSNALYRIIRSNGLYNIHDMLRNYRSPIANIQTVARLTNGLNSLSDITPELIEMSQSSAGKLSDIEITTIENSNNVEIKTLLSTYYNLKNRLAEDACPILQHRPNENAPQDTLVLVKQYYQGNAWMPVPNASTIFDMNSLKQLCLMDNPRHPLRRDSFVSPDKYEVNGIAYDTRYGFHHYYINETNIGSSQELVMKEAELRARLQALPVVKAARMTVYTNNKATLFAASNVVIPVHEEHVEESMEMENNFIL